MKLLLDENLSRRLVPALQERFPGSSQVALLGLERATDAALCEYAAERLDAALADPAVGVVVLE